MDPTKQRIAIAEACGFKRESWPGGIYWYNQDHPSCQDGKVINDEEELPDYLTDLNAMHEAEEVLTDAQTCEYFCLLCKLPKDRNGNAAIFWAVVHATATQRAEAFLRCLGKWVD